MLWRNNRRRRRERRGGKVEKTNSFVNLFVFEFCGILMKISSHRPFLPRQVQGNSM